jgi:hypothetical protein
MATVQAQVTITGIRPLLWHRFGLDALPIEKKARSGVAGNDPDEWRKTVLATKTGQLYIEPTYVFGSLRDGARLIPYRKGSLQSVVVSALQVKETRILIDRSLPKGDLRQLIQAEDQPVYLDVRGVRNPATHARNVRYRVAASPGWRASFTLSWENTLLSENQVRAVLNDAGQFKGVGDGRNIGFGRFRVTTFKLIAEARRAKKPNAK